jgi:hypothetical protein
LSKKTTIFFLDSPKWEKKPNNGINLMIRLAKTHQNRPKVGNEKGLSDFLDSPSQFVGLIQPGRYIFMFTC